MASELQDTKHLQRVVVELARGWRSVTKTILVYDFACATVSTLIAGVMGNALPNGGQMC